MSAQTTTDTMRVTLDIASETIKDKQRANAYETLIALDLQDANQDSAPLMTRSEDDMWRVVYEQTFVRDRRPLHEQLQRLAHDVNRITNLFELHLKASTHLHVTWDMHIATLTSEADAQQFADKLRSALSDADRTYTDIRVDGCDVACRFERSYEPSVDAYPAVILYEVSRVAKMLT